MLDYSVPIELLTEFSSSVFLIGFYFVSTKIMVAMVEKGPGDMY